MSTFLSEIYGWELKKVKENNDSVEEVKCHIHDYSGDNVWTITHVEEGKHTISIGS